MVLRSRWASALQGSSRRASFRSDRRHVGFAAFQVDAAAGGVGLAQAPGKLGQSGFGVLGRRDFRCRD